MAVPKTEGAGAVAAADVSVTPLIDAAPRILLLGPFRIIRNKCARETDFESIETLRFIDTHMAYRFHCVEERDPLMDTIVYKMSIKMTDEHWIFYNNILAKHSLASDVHMMLARGNNDFNHYTRSPGDQEAIFNILRNHQELGHTMESQWTLVKTFRDQWIASGTVNMTKFIEDLQRNELSGGPE